MKLALGHGIELFFTVRIDLRTGLELDKFLKLLHDPIAVVVTSTTRSGVSQVVYNAHASVGGYGDSVSASQWIKVMACELELDGINAIKT